MAIELISTITTKNNGSYAIALSNEIQGGLHSKKTLKERDNISTLYIGVPEESPLPPTEKTCQTSSFHW